MKKLTIIGLFSVCAAGLYAQGTLTFYNDISGTIVTHIYAPNPANPTVEQTGNGPGDYPVGTWNYSTFTAIGGSTGAAGTPINYAFGNNFSVSIYALGLDNPNAATDGSYNPLYHGANTLFSSLQPVTTYMSTLTTSASFAPGIFLANNPTVDPGIPNTGYNDGPNNPSPNAPTIDNVAAVAVVAWYNAGNTITSYATAAADLAAGQNVPVGHSAVFAMTTLGEPSSVNTAEAGTPEPASFAGNMTKLTSFSLQGLSATPEPSTIALGVMGACAFLARRRKK